MAKKRKLKKIEKERFQAAILAGAPGAVAQSLALPIYLSQAAKTEIPAKEALKYYEKATGEKLWEAPMFLLGRDRTKAKQPKGTTKLITHHEPIPNYGVGLIGKKKVLVVPAQKKLSPYTLLHEAGHAKGRGIKELKRLEKLMLPARLAPFAVLGVLPFTESEKAEKAGYIAGGVGGLASLPMLGEEARASWRAIKWAPKMGLSKGKAIKVLLPAFGTYLGSAALAVTPPIALGRYFAAKARAKKLKKKRKVRS